MDEVSVCLHVDEKQIIPHSFQPIPLQQIVVRVKMHNTNAYSLHVNVKSVLTCLQALCQLTMIVRFHGLQEIFREA